MTDPFVRLEAQLLAACREFALVEDEGLLEAIQQARLLLDEIENAEGCLSVAGILPRGPGEPIAEEAVRRGRDEDPLDCQGEE